MAAILNHQTRAQIRRMCKDFIVSRYRGESVNAIKASQEIHNLWAVSIDWHEFTNVLESMVAYQEAEYTDIDRNGCQNYIII